MAQSVLPEGMAVIHFLTAATAKAYKARRSLRALKR